VLDAIVCCCKKEYRDRAAGILSGCPLVQTGVHGYPFITAVERARLLLVGLDKTLHKGETIIHTFEMSQSIVLAALVVYNLVLAQLFITGLTGLGAYFFLSAFYGSNLNSIAAPLLLTILLSASVVGVFTTLLATVIVTVTQNYAKDFVLYKNPVQEGGTVKQKPLPKKIEEFCEAFVAAVKSHHGGNSHCCLRRKTIPRWLSPPLLSNRVDDHWKEIAPTTQEP